MINWLIAAIALVGVVLNVWGKWQGFLFWLISNAWWCGYNYVSNEYAQSVLFGAFWFLSLYGIYKWRKNREATEKKIEQAKAERRNFNNKQMSTLFHNNFVMAQHIVGQKHPKKSFKKGKSDGKRS